MVNCMSHLLVHLLNIHEHTWYANLLDLGKIIHLRKLLSISAILMCEEWMNMLMTKLMNDVGKKLGHSQKWLIKADISENGEVGSSIDTHQKKKRKSKTCGTSFV